MGVFSTKKIILGNPSLIPTVAERIKQEFENEKFTVQVDLLASGGADISLAKGNIVVALFGMKSALKVLLLPHGDAISFEASVGVFGQQIIPSLISWFLYWPVLVTQIWGLIQQSKLDDKALDVAERTVASQSEYTLRPQERRSESALEAKFCPNCGAKVNEGAAYCSKCGEKL